MLYIYICYIYIYVIYIYVIYIYVIYIYVLYMFYICYIYIYIYIYIRIYVYIYVGMYETLNGDGHPISRWRGRDSGSNMDGYKKRAISPPQRDPIWGHHRMLPSSSPHHWQGLQWGTCNLFGIFQFSFGTLSLNGSEIGVISMASLDPLCSEYPYQYHITITFSITMDTISITISSKFKGVSTSKILRTRDLGRIYDELDESSFFRVPTCFFCWIAIPKCHRPPGVPTQLCHSIQTQTRSQVQGQLLCFMGQGGHMDCGP